ncbi:MAG TPA: cell wall hydrolase [Oscillospiraceae bacterium]|nr:cell wall hydrolase [Oscillospiraceae bacterium]HPS75163.1 cell wall hydrolase [Oscillospiraceae bacterium]
MKKLMSLLLALALCAGLIPAARAQTAAPDDGMDAMIAAAAAGDLEAGALAETERNARIDAEGLPLVKVRFAELCLLARLIYAEAGSSWLSDEWKFCVGEVVMNRVASPEFPDTLEEVIYQPGQYYGRRSRYFASLVPGETEIRAASRLLQGERHMSPAVVFQANFPQGSGTYLHLRDKILGSTYLCLSSHPKLYTA